MTSCSIKDLKDIKENRLQNYVRKLFFFINKTNRPVAYLWSDEIWNERDGQKYNLKLFHSIHKKNMFTHNWQLNEDMTPFFIKYSYIWHFTGFPIEDRTKIMKQVWNFSLVANLIILKIFVKISRLVKQKKDFLFLILAYLHLVLFKI